MNKTEDFSKPERAQPQFYPHQLANKMIEQY